MHPRRVCTITSGRADYGLLYWPMRDLDAATDLTLQLVVTGMHLEDRFGSTVKQIQADGFDVAARVPLGHGQGGPAGPARAMAAAVSGIAEALEQLKPDLVVLLGDRFEMLGCAAAAMLASVPIVHIGGGDVTEGSFDDGARHAITKLAHVHLATHERAAARIAQLGEAPDRIHVVGNPGLDWITRAPMMDRAALEAALGRGLGARNLLVTFHPVTLASDYGVSQFSVLLAALATLPEDVVLWFTRPNADPGHEALDARLDAWAAGRSNVRIRRALGPAYLSLLANVDAVVGNSSSGLTEAPTFGVAAVNVGDRQSGRTAGDTVIHAPADCAATAAAITQAMTMDCRGAVNPYGDGRSSGRIVSIIRELPPRDILLRKRFHDLA